LTGFLKLQGLPARVQRLELGGSPTVDEPLPPKAKWKHHKRYQRLRNQAEALERAIKSRRFAEPTKVFAYHLPA